MKLLCATVFTLTITTFSFAETLTVDDDGLDFPGADYSSIQDAVDASDNGDEILVYPGTYYELVNLNEKNVIVRSDSGPDLTIIDGEGIRRCVICFTDFDIRNNDDKFIRTIDGFTLRNGTDAYTVQGEGGGGMTIKDCDVLVNNCIFTNNNAVGYYDTDEDNDGYGWGIGGGLAGSESNITITNCTFTGNTANGLFISAGGAVFIMEAYDVVITDSTFANNNSTDSTGKGLATASAIYASGRIFQNSTLEFSQSTVEGNDTTGSFTFGGAVAIDSQNSGSITDVTITSNTATDNSVDFSNAGITITNCGNESTSEYLTISECVVTDNILTDTGTGYDYSDIQISSSNVLFDGSNTFGESGAYDWDRYENPETLIRFTNDTFCVGESDFLATSLTTLAFDVDDVASTEFLEIESGIMLNGCLSISNSSDSLSSSSVGDKYNLIQSGSVTGFFESEVFPKMPEGLGLRVVEETASRNETTMVSLEVIGVDEVDVDQPVTEGLDGTAVDIVAFDINNDGYDELAILFDGSPGIVRVYSVSGDGNAPTAISELTTDVGNNPVDIDAGDVDGDGRDDLLITNSNDSELTLLITHGSQENVSFLSTTINVSGSSQTLTCGAIIDWDGSGTLDCIIGVATNDVTLEDGLRIITDLSNFPSENEYLEIPLYDNGLNYVGDTPTSVSGAKGEYTAWGFVAGTKAGRMYRSSSSVGSLETIAELVNSEIISIDAVNLDSDSGDGVLDLLAASADSKTIYIAQGDTTEQDGFGEIVILYVDDEMTSVISMDADDDGDKDIVYASPQSEMPLVILRRDPPGTSFNGEEMRGSAWSKQDANSESSSKNLVSGTLGGKDEDDDWIVGAGDDESGLRGFSSMEQTNLFLTDTACVADLDSDGEVKLADLLILIGEWGQCSTFECISDLDGDGEVKLADLLILIGAWGACP